MHSGGANVGMADGSTRFMSDNIDGTTWKNLGGIDDGFSVSNY